jgi:hypothetical protein
MPFYFDPGRWLLQSPHSPEGLQQERRADFEGRGGARLRRDCRVAACVNQEIESAKLDKLGEIPSSKSSPPCFRQKSTSLYEFNSLPILSRNRVAASQCDFSLIVGHTRLQQVLDLL